MIGRTKHIGPKFDYLDEVRGRYFEPLREFTNDLETELSWLVRIFENKGHNMESNSNITGTRGRQANHRWTTNEKGLYLHGFTPTILLSFLSHHRRTCRLPFGHLFSTLAYIYKMNHLQWRKSRELTWGGSIS